MHYVKRERLELTSSEHVDGLGGVGLGTCILSARAPFTVRGRPARLTNGADDGTAAELALGSILSVELREPLNSGAASLEVCDCVGHLVCLVERCEVVGERRRERQGSPQSEKTRRLLREAVNILASAG